ncbi:ribosome small subunit-dependent GTPase A [Amphibacillus cookii]|uniref:ribosome small subunit-dependent GTPase A n=1 Tax=Amphibacillus cookii TaxID=767787 RepID=UPI00195E296B|nr:ribosome small subunit-dependent GTPase A [Amphibacillus cookii]MBM7540529.1 ribosome biogenesis GTPase [Amphibacillus cookii]
MPEGQIIKALSGFYYVNSQGITYQCRARGLFRKQKQTPLVGDFVVFEAENLTDGYVTALLPRKNQLIRPPVANVDQALITVSAKEPEFSTILLDRFLVLVEFNHIEPIILITKIDLLTKEEASHLNMFVENYRSLGYQVKLLSDKPDQNLQEMQATLAKRTSVIAGQSGVGKSSLLNRLNSDLSIKTAQISASLGRGKHTTRHVELVEVSNGLVADTPGFSSLDFEQLSREALPLCFPEFEHYRSQCKFRGCMHIEEPKCAVKAALEQGEIAEYRYQHYLQFEQEIHSRKPRY